MGIIAGLVVQASLKRMLEFGSSSTAKRRGSNSSFNGGGDGATNYLGYAALTDFFPTMTLRANPGCSNGSCLAAQAWAASQKPSAEDQAAEQAMEREEEEERKRKETITHEENEWAIECVNDNNDQTETAASVPAAPTSLPAGVQFSIPFAAVAASPEVPVVAETEAGVDDLMAQLAALNQK